MKRIIPITLFLLVSPPAAAIPADVTVGFSDQRTTEPAVVTAIGSARSRIRLAIFSLNEPGIVSALAAASRRGVDVRIKYDPSQAVQPVMGKALADLAQAGAKAASITMPGRSYMHHKFLVVDGLKTVTGSFNFTQNATHHNWENLVIISSPDVASAYEAEWTRITPYAKKKP